MRILVIGGAWTIGRWVVEYLTSDHEIIVAGLTSGQVTVDFTSSDSIKEMLDEVGNVDAIVCIAGEAR